MSAQAIVDRYHRRIGQLPGDAGLGEHRRRALERFAELGFPGKKLEAWHYTDLTALAGRDLDYIGGLPDEAAVAAARRRLAKLDLDPESPTLVFVDGHLSDRIPARDDLHGLDIEAIADAARLLPGSPAAEDSALAALNFAFVQSGLLIRVAARIERPVQLICIGSGRDRASQLRLRLELGPDSAATIVQHFVDLDGAGAGWLNLTTDIELAERSELTLNRLQSHGPERVQTSLTRAALAADARLVTGSLELGGLLIRHELLVTLSGRAANTQISGLALTNGQQHCDTRIVVDHAAPETLSRQDYRAIAADRSRCIFNGKVRVHENAQHVDARQRNDNLLLSGTAEIDTKPELEIYADQVICSHGATVGELSEEQLFYLRSRGLDDRLARSILTTAFAEVILERFSGHSFSDQARAAVGIWLQSHQAAAQSSA